MNNAIASTTLPELSTYVIELSLAGGYSYNIFDVAAADEAEMLANPAKYVRNFAAKVAAEIRELALKRDANFKKYTIRFLLARRDGKYFAPPHKDLYPASVTVKP